MTDKEHGSFGAVYSSVIRQYLSGGEFVTNENGRYKPNNYFAFDVYL